MPPRQLTVSTALIRQSCTLESKVSAFNYKARAAVHIPSATNFQLAHSRSSKPTSESRPRAGAKRKNGRACAAGPVLLLAGTAGAGAMACVRSVTFLDCRAAPQVCHNRGAAARKCANCGL